MQTEIIYGIHPIEEAIRAGRRRIDEIFLAKDSLFKKMPSLAELTATGIIPVRQVSPGRMHQLVGTVQHQGAAARVSAYPLADFSSVIASADRPSAGRILVLLDNILDPQNLGAVIRTALGVGADGVVVPKDRAAGPTPAVSKASAGALEHIRLARVTNLAASLRRLKSRGWWVCGLDQSAELSLYAADLTQRVAMVIGGEEKGIRPLVRQNCDFVVSIPQCGPVASLNASAAAAVAMYEAFRQHLGSRPSKERRQRD